MSTYLIAIITVVACAQGAFASDVKKAVENAEKASQYYRGHQCAKAVVRESRWRTGNNGFYTTMGPEFLQSHIRGKGLAGCCDLKTDRLASLLGVWSVFSPPQRVLVVGGGTGRETRFLMNLDRIKEIHVIEVVPSNNTFLIDEFSPGAEIPRARVQQGLTATKFVLYEENIGHRDALPQDLRVDVALGLFGVFLELSPQEKVAAVNNLAQAVVRGGVVVIDIPVQSLPEGAKQHGNSASLPGYFGSGMETLFLHPMVKGKRKIDEVALAAFFTNNGRFQFSPEADTVIYATESRPAQMRKLFFFTRR